MEARVQKMTAFNLQSSKPIKSKTDPFYSKLLPSNQAPQRNFKTDTSPLKKSSNTMEHNKKFTFYKNQTMANALRQIQGRERPQSAVNKSPLYLTQKMKERVQKQKSETQRSSTPLVDNGLKQRYISHLQYKKGNQEYGYQQYQIASDKRLKNLLVNNDLKIDKNTQKVVPRAKSAQVASNRERITSTSPHKQYQMLVQPQKQASEQFRNLTQLRLQRVNNQLNRITKTVNQTCQFQYKMKPKPPPSQDRNQKLAPQPPARQMKVKEVFLDINSIVACTPLAQSVRPVTQGNDKAIQIQLDNKALVSNIQVKLNGLEEHRKTPDVKSQPFIKLADHKEVNEASDLKLNLDSSFIKNASKLEEYVIGKTIGQGAYAIVRHAVHKPTNKSVAIKIYDKYKLLDPSKRKNVKREIEIMSKLQHPNIAQLIEAIESSKQLYLVQEYCQGINLHQLVKKQSSRKLPEFYAKSIFQQILSGISYCHEQNISHRDLKLENILIDEINYIVKIIDFGFSTMINKKIRVFCGTPSYMAPEIVNKKEFFGQHADI